MENPKVIEVVDALQRTLRDLEVILEYYAKAFYNK